MQLASESAQRQAELEVANAKHNAAQAAAAHKSAAASWQGELDWQKSEVCPPAACVHLCILPCLGYESHSQSSTSRNSLKAEPGQAKASQEQLSVTNLVTTRNLGHLVIIDHQSIAYCVQACAHPYAM